MYEKSASVFNSFKQYLTQQTYSHKTSPMEAYMKGTQVSLTQAGPSFTVRILVINYFELREHILSYL